MPYGIYGSKQMKMAEAAFAPYAFTLTSISNMVPTTDTVTNSTVLTKTADIFTVNGSFL